MNVTLPFAWYRVPCQEREESTKDVEAYFASEHGVVLAQSLRRIDGELNTFFATMKSTDIANSTASMLQLLNTKLALLASYLVYPTPSATFELSLSSEGLAFSLLRHQAQVKEVPSSRLAWHLQLPSGHHIMGLGTVVALSAEETDAEQKGSE